MRILMSYVFLLAVSVQLYANDNFSGRLTGYWVNPVFDEAIKIVDMRDGILINGLFNTNRSIFFERINKNKFIDCKRNIIRLEDKETLIFISRRSHEYIRFEKTHYGGHRGNCNDDDYYYDPYDHPQKNGKYKQKYKGKQREDRYEDEDDFGDDEFGDDYRNFKEYDDDYLYRKNSKPKSENKVKISDDLLKTIIGTYAVKGSKETVVITDTREGFKAKFSGSKNWVNYTKASNTEYIDEKGNKYTLIGNTLNWISKDGKKNYILKKISDEIKY